MTDRHIQNLLFEYVEGTLDPEANTVVEAHLKTCTTCHDELEQVRALTSATAGLPRAIEPPEDLWPGIESRLVPLHQNGVAATRPDRLPHLPERRRFRPAWPVRIGALVLLLAAGAGLFRLLQHSPRPAWDVVQLEGTPRIGSTGLTQSGKLHEGDWLETDLTARARIEVGGIGRVDVEPGTRIGIVSADPDNHRLSLTHGTIEARILAPPRLFLVETPSVLAIDLGCVYTLTVDDAGGSLLSVTSGWVALQDGDRETVVPAGAMCRTRPGAGPGTPFDQGASEAFRDALDRFDFDNGGPGVLDTLLELARPHDAITLWHLLRQPLYREQVYDRLLAFESPPEGVTRAGVLGGDPAMLELWEQHLGLDYDGWTIP